MRRFGLIDRRSSGRVHTTKRFIGTYFLMVRRDIVCLDQTKAMQKENNRNDVGYENFRNILHVEPS